MSMSHATDPVPGSALSSPHLLFALCAMSFVGPLSDLTLSPLLVAISRDLDISVPLLAQTATGTILFSGALGLAFGPLADALGHRRAVLAGAVALAISGFGAALSPSYLTL